MLRLTILLAVSCLQSISGNNVELLISEKGLNYTAEVILDYLTSTDLVLMNFPDARKQSLNLFVMTLEVELRDVKVTNFTKPKVAVKVKPRVGLTLTLEQMYLAFEGNWKYRTGTSFVDFKDNGRITGEAKGANLTLQLSVTLSNGKPLLKVDSCNSAVDDFNAQFYGPLELVYNFIFGFYREASRQSAQTVLCGEAAKMIHLNVDRKLESLDTLVRINRHLRWDFNLSQINFLADAVRTQHLGFFLDDVVRISLPPSTIVLSPDRMIAVGFSEEVLNSGLRVVHKTGGTRFSYDFTFWKDLSKLLGLNLTVDEGPHKVTVSTNIPPVARIAPDGVSLTLSGILQVVSLKPTLSPILAPSLPVPPFDVRFNLAVRVVTAIQLDKLMIGVNRLSLVVTSVNPLPPGLNLGGVNRVIGVITEFVKAQLNSKIDLGLKLPEINGLTLTNATLELNDRYASISSDVRYRL